MKRFFILSILCVIATLSLHSMACASASDRVIMKNFKIFLYGPRFDGLIDERGMQEERHVIVGLKNKYYSEDNQLVSTEAAKRARVYLRTYSDYIVENNSKFKDVLSALTIDFMIALEKISLHPEN